MQPVDLLVNELQLGQQLNQAVSRGERSDFGLLLAMLSADVRDQAQFHLETPKEEVLFEQAALRERFQLPKEQSLVADEAGEAHSLALGQVAQEQGLAAARLEQALSPEPLTYELHRREGLAMEVYDNLEFQTAAKFTGRDKVPELDTVDFNALLKAQQSYNAQLVA